MNENEIAEKIIGLAIKVHSNLGPGLLETIYEKALAFELHRNGFQTDVQKALPVMYEGMVFDEGYRADIIVNNLVIIELKSVKCIDDLHIKQLLTYLRLSNMKLGLIINFNEIMLKNGIRRIINGTI
ncbi:MAG: GxxExxY protein [Chitinispirillaceae bacterium]|nr:GxxExxY protein [Chitinispirillaceae bacterium]